MKPFNERKAQKAAPQPAAYHVWSDLDNAGSTSRMNVPGGWIYRYVEEGPSEQVASAVSMVFVPDPRP